MLTPLIASIFVISIILLSSPSKKSQELAQQVCNFTKTSSTPPSYPQFNQLSLQNDEKLVWPLPLACKPESFGYSNEEASKLFKDADFKSCDKYPSTPSLYFQDDYLHMNCKGKYLLGPTHELFGRFEFEDELKRYKKKVKVTSEEFAIGTCVKESEGFFEDIAYRNVVNLTALNRAKEKVMGKPVNIAMVVLDSVSRRSFYRKLPKTVKFLNNQTRLVHDFLVHNVNGEYSADSFMPSFMGDIPFYRLKNEEIDGRPFDENLIFSYMHDKGFVTYMATDDCGNDLAAFIGRSSQVDHKIASFYCAAEKYYNFINNAKRQRCIGRKNAHSWMLDYLLEFSQNYESVNRFSYIHLNTAHEGSGTVISSLDDDLVSFIESFYKLPGPNVLFLMGDHGMRYGSWFTQIDGSHEHRLPLLLISAAGLENNFPKLDLFLNHNTKRLVTKLDLHLTLKTLASGSFGDDLICETSKRYRSYSLIQEAIPDDRTCSSSGIPLFWCSCMPFKDSPQLKTSAYLQSIVQEILHQLNSQNLKPLFSAKTVCKSLSLSEIKSVKTQQAYQEQYYTIKFTISESQDVLFETLVLISDIKLRKRERDGFGSFSFWQSGKKYLKIMYVKRLDAYAGVCQEVCSIQGLDPMFCICQEFDVLRHSHKAIMQSVYKLREVLITDLACEHACSRLEMDCDEFAGVLFSTCSSLPKGLCSQCKASAAGYSYIENSKCFLDFSHFSCTDTHKNSICLCKKVN